MTKLKLCFTFPPSVNHCYFTNPRGQRILTKEGKEWMKSAQWYAMVEAKKHGWQPMTRHTYADMYFYMPDKRQRDSHNYLKVLLDALEGPIVENDKWLLPRIQDVVVDRDEPRIEVIVWPQ